MGMGKLRIWTAVLVLAGVTTACSSESEDRTGATRPTTASSGGRKTGDSELRVVGRNLRFDVGELSAPARTAFTIVFDNRDQGVPHNLAVYRFGPPAKDAVANTPTKPGPETQRLAVSPLEAGRYFYQCDVHPTTMTGTLVVA